MSEIDSRAYCFGCGAGPGQECHDICKDLQKDKEVEKLRAQLAAKSSEAERLRECLEEFRRCVEGGKIPDDHSDEDEYCDEGMCMWIGQEAKRVLALAPRDEKPANTGEETHAD